MHTIGLVLIDMYEHSLSFVVIRVVDLNTFVI
jgi:hypothetical protein